MNTKHQKYTQICLFLICLFSASWTQAATLKLVFYDDSKNVVGNGQFSFDKGTASPVGVKFVKNPLTDFSANIQEMHWSFTHLLWWAAEGQVPGSLHDNSEPVSGWTWDASDSINGEGGLSMDFLNANDTSGNGNWSQVAYNTPNAPSGYFESNGTWTASVVTTPIPAAVWLFGSGFGVLGIFKRKMLVKM